MDLVIRYANEHDLPGIVDIYNQSIPGGWSTADTRPIFVEDRRTWFAQFQPDSRPIWVAEIEGELAGTTYLSSFYAGRPAYHATAEISVYIAAKFQKRGLGRKLKEYVISQCPRLGVTTLLSFYFDHNLATKRINDALGFETMGHLKEIAEIQGQKRGLIIAGLRIQASSDSVLPPSES